jgi:hypothetical protein
MKTRWIVPTFLTVFVLVLSLVFTVGMRVVDNGYSYRPVAIREYDVTAGVTTATWTVPNMALANAIHAYPQLDDIVTTNTPVSWVKCTTAGSVNVKFARTVAFTGTYTLIYNPGD